MADKQIQQQQEAVFVPSNIQPGGYVTFCWYNNDIAEKTKPGGGTTHCTDGIIVQRQMTEPIQCLTAANEPSSTEGRYLHLWR